MGKARAWGRAALAGPGALASSVAVLLGMPLWVPPGAGSVDNLALPLVAFPLVWAILFFHALLDRSLARAASVSIILGGGHAWLVAARLSETAA